MAKKNIIVIDSRTARTKRQIQKLFEETKKKLKGENVIIDLRDVERLTAQGFSQVDLSNFYGIAPETFSRQKTDSEILSQALRQGKAQDLSSSTLELQKMIKQKKSLHVKFSAVRFNLCARHGWKENAPAEESPLDKEEFQKYINDLLFA